MRPSMALFHAEETVETCGCGVEARTNTWSYNTSIPVAFQLRAELYRGTRTDIKPRPLWLRVFLAGGSVLPVQSRGSVDGVEAARAGVRARSVEIRMSPHFHAPEAGLP